METSPKCLHQNVNRSFAVSSKLGKTVLSHSIDLICLNEPHVCEGTVIGSPDGFSSHFFGRSEQSGPLEQTKTKVLCGSDTRDIVAVRSTVCEERRC